jgi:hypothetical protein
MRIPVADISSARAIVIPREGRRAEVLDEDMRNEPSPSTAIFLGHSLAASYRAERDGRIGLMRLLVYIVPLDEL